MVYIAHCLAKNLMRERRCIAFTEKKETKDVRDGITFLPLEIDVRNTAGELLNLDEQCGD